MEDQEDRLNELLGEIIKKFLEVSRAYEIRRDEGVILAASALEHWADFFDLWDKMLLNCGFRGGRHKGQDSGYTDYNNSPIDHHAFFVYRGVEFEIISTEGYLVVSCRTHPALVNNSTAKNAEQVYTPRQLLLAMVAQINMTTPMTKEY